MSFWAEFALRAAVVMIAAYFCGCFNGAVIVSKYILHNDIRAHGSGNAGLTNFHRTFGGPLTFAVIMMDAVKAVVAVLIGAWLLGNMEGMVLVGKYWGAVWCLLGHMFPCMFEFKGGKGILSGGAVALMIDWRIALVVWGGFLLLVLFTRYVSLGSVWAGASFPFISWYCYPDPVVVVLAFLCGGLVVWQHRGNIQRLLNGNERKLTFRRKKGEAQ